MGWGEEHKPHAKPKLLSREGLALLLAPDLQAVGRLMQGARDSLDDDTLRAVVMRSHATQAPYEQALACIDEAIAMLLGRD